MGRIEDCITLCWENDGEYKLGSDSCADVTNCNPIELDDNYFKLEDGVLTLNNDIINIEEIDGKKYLKLSSDGETFIQSANQISLEVTEENSGGIELDSASVVSILAAKDVDVTAGKDITLSAEEKIKLEGTESTIIESPFISIGIDTVESKIVIGSTSANGVGKYLKLTVTEDGVNTYIGMFKNSMEVFSRNIIIGNFYTSAVTIKKVVDPISSDMAANKNYVDNEAAKKANIIPALDYIDWDPYGFDIPAGRTLQFNTSTFPALVGNSNIDSMFAIVNGNPDLMFGFYINTDGKTIFGLFHIDGNNNYVSDIVSYDGTQWLNDGKYTLRYGIQGDFNQSIGSPYLQGFNLYTDVTVLDVSQKDLIDVDNKIGELGALNTQRTNNIVSAINEVQSLSVSSKLYKGTIPFGIDTASNVDRIPTTGLVYNKTYDCYIQDTDFIIRGTYNGISLTWVDVTTNYLSGAKIGDTYIIERFYGYYLDANYDGNANGSIILSNPNPSEFNFDLILSENTPIDNSTLILSNGIMTVSHKLSLTGLGPGHLLLQDMSMDGKSITLGTNLLGDGPAVVTASADYLTIGSVEVNTNVTLQVGSADGLKTVSLNKTPIPLKLAVDLDLNNHKITNVDTPIDPEDAVNKKYVDYQNWVFETEEDFEDAKEDIPVGATVIKLYEYGDNFTDFIVPDYENMETISRINASNGTWTADRTGFVYVGVVAVPTAIGTQYGYYVQVNGKTIEKSFNADGAQGDLGTTIPIKKGDIIRIIGVGILNFINCYYIPPRLNKIAPPITIQPSEEFLAGYMMLPDYASMVQITSINDTNQSWTVPTAGFIRCVITNNIYDNARFLVNNKEILNIVNSNHGQSENMIIPVAAGDIVRTTGRAAESDAATSVIYYLYFYNARYVLKELPVIVEKNGSYSLQEIKTNDTWIDGKPIYRKVYKGTLPESAANQFLIVVLEYTSNFSELIKSGGYLNVLNYSKISVGDNFLNEIVPLYSSIYFDSSNSYPTLRVRSGNSIVAPNNNYCVWIEYTKITD